MQPTIKKKILIVLTNTTRYGHTNDATGLWLGEATEFAQLVQQAGYQVDYVSPKGGFVPLDPRSMKYVDDEIMAFYETPDFQERALTHSLAPNDVNSADYAAIYYAGGHGVMWDFPDNPELQALATAIYDQNGYVTAVCHGIAGLLNIQDRPDHYLIADRRVTGFTKMEERLAGKTKVVPFFNQTIATEHGAHFQKKRAYREYAVQDDRLITGQNPFSAKAVAQLLIQSLAAH
ncbi:type 1 glutamine amidotransferase domain-containing protein [Lactiplantibacillus mudanjiangensis]|uniref:Intracellular protease/amidase [Lactobacillus brevis ATCC 367] n=1 Tax=Lactiplantibacillus mudanjiangensis TaxID=1296538 RepID=A0A660DZX5_9LACO|nr:type 1 glutamine amidotransferase domain-containing protein [Lactiplantibacillus mudanjiangensis]VDG19526.1 Putative intracellular protease/amidase [Lactobacillus brevis ATCC 367] [Lactiplantibacillus mudanjiangensis]VDG23357.1 Putative intracellular protease/amidase [Lactobacillus brevis ATCC 367] [Lactiplantibacillus mudanjiangensis]VDG28760.1 Putative intracellular protease/amidase [Lactobacillus brevis ATCC 367] [Lactiplantibacillus mudanjiangensis]VDG30976.1 Putative intracellular prote